MANPNEPANSAMEEEVRNRQQSPPPPPSKNTYAQALVVPMVRFMMGVLGAAVGSSAAFFITINYIERFKAEEALRMFAFTEVYQPLKDRIKSCQDIRNQAAKNTATVHHTNQWLERYLAVAHSGGSLETLEFLLPALEGLIETYNKESAEASLSYLAIQNCEREVENAGHDLATVLNLNDKYQFLLTEQAKRRPPLPDFTEEGNLFSRFLGDPEMISGLARAFEDAQAGNVIRGDSALSAIRSQAAKTSTASKALLDYHYASISHGQVVDKEFTELFLRDFRNRFEKKPHLSLNTLLRSTLDSTYD